MTFHWRRYGSSTIRHQKDFNITADNGRAWQLDLIAEANQKLKMQIESRDHEHKDH